MVYHPASCSTQHDHDLAKAAVTTVSAQVNEQLNYLENKPALFAGCYAVVQDLQRSLEFSPDIDVSQVEHPIFTAVIVAAILTNTVLLALDHHDVRLPQTPTLITFLLCRSRSRCRTRSPMATSC